MFQGFLAGLWFMVGFQLGFAVRALGRVLTRKFRKEKAESEPLEALPEGTMLDGNAPDAKAPGWKTPPAKNSRAKVLFPAVVGLGLIAYVIGYGALVVAWQNRVRELVEMPPVDGAGHRGFLLSMFATMAVFYGIARGISALRGWVAGGLPGGVHPLVRCVGPHGPRRCLSGAPARWTGRWRVAAVESIYADRDAGTLAGSVQPQCGTDPGRPNPSPNGTGWAGRVVPLPAVGRAPHTSRGSPAPPPWNRSASMRDCPRGTTCQARAKLVVEELDRTGGFDREVLLVATPTGSGWLEPQAIASLEYLYGGNTATASMQYSFQPSWVSFLFDPELAATSSRALFDAVHARWQELPEDQRPRLAVYGLSLGAQGMAGSFENLDDLLARTDAALFTGPPANSQPWRGLQANRDAGSPIWQPVYQGGEQVRWQSKPGDFAALGGNLAAAADRLPAARDRPDHLA